MPPPIPAPPPIGLNLQPLVSYPSITKPTPATPVMLRLVAAVTPETRRVDFFVETFMGTLPVGTVMAAPWSVDVTTVWVGPLTFTAVGMDASGTPIARSVGAAVTIG